MTESRIPDPDFAYLGSLEPDAPPCVWCKRRPQGAVRIGGERMFIGRCEPCAKALSDAAQRHIDERAAKEAKEAEMAKRERDGLPKVGATPSVRPYRRAGDS